MYLHVKYYVSSLLIMILTFYSMGFKSPPSLPN